MCQKACKAAGNPYHAVANQHLAFSAKRTGIYRKINVSP